MKHIPILFSDEMVKAILAGDKTETRRLMGRSKMGSQIWGQPGDLLWVRETHYCWGQWVENGKTAKGRQKWRFVADDSNERGGILCYSNEDPGKWERITVRPNSYRKFGIYKRLGRFLPKKYARLWLERTEEMRWEPLQSITEEGAEREGAQERSHRCGGFGYYEGGGEIHECICQNWPYEPRMMGFIDLWDRIHSADGHGWYENPAVFVVTFKQTNYKTNQI